MEHSYFGKLVAEGGRIYKSRTVSLAGRPVEVELECEDASTEAQLDAAARFVRHLDRFDTVARAAIAADQDEYGTPMYIEHHLAELPPEVLTRIFAVDRAAITRDVFLAELVLRGVWFAELDDPESFVHFDYTIAPRETDYVIAVTFTSTGEVASVDVES